VTSPYTVTIPANLEREDRLVGNLTARQLAILTPTALLVWALYLATSTLIPFPVFAALAIPLIGVAAALALAERDGITVDRLALHALAHARRPRRLVLSPNPIPALPAWAAAAEQEAPLPAPLRLPAQAIRADGAINLGTDGVAVIVACTTVSFALRTPNEQAALVGAFGGWLNALTGPAQILVHAQPINLAPAITLLQERAAGLPHPALEDAALDHARFLAELAATRELLGRQVLIVLREPSTAHPATGTSADTRKLPNAEAAALRVLQRAEQTTRALAAAGITAYLLDGAQAAAVLAAAADPTAPPMDPGQAMPEEPITTNGTRTGVKR
jgi:PrgI family protein